MRGKASNSRNFAVLARITPAYAGKSLRLLYHRGEFLGSPPPMRGKAMYELTADYLEGITPAYAGKSTYLPAQCYNN